MDLGDHGSYYVAGSSRYLLSWPFSWIHAASQPSNMLRILILGQMVGREESLACDCSQLSATPSKEHATEVTEV